MTGKPTGTGPKTFAVGPILDPGPKAQAVVQAITATNPDAKVVDYGAYWRVTAPGRCVVTRAAIEAALGGAFDLPGDLERIMPSFRGRLVIDSDTVLWCEGVRQ